MKAMFDSRPVKALMHVVGTIRSEADDYGRETADHGAAVTLADRIEDHGSITTERARTYGRAFHDMLVRTRERPNIIPLDRALKVIDGDGHGEWHEYAAKRLAQFNHGEVDMDVVPRFAARARVHHRGKVPHRDFKMVKAYTGPRSEAEVTMAAWDAFFAEGGSLNQPYWLETDRLKQLRHEYERLANVHGGRK